MPFDPVDPKQSLPDLEEGILQYWREEDIFKRSIEMRGQTSDDVLSNPNAEGITNDQKINNQNAFSFYDGPPFATGLPHYGHLLAGTIKDVIPRYQTMRANKVERRFGWDCHGLPIENIIEKEHDIQDKKQIEEMGIGAFNDLCRSAVQRHASDWREVVERMGRFVDMDWDYKTMDPDFMESIWWVFSELHSKGLIYEGYKPMHICPRCVTPLSNFEVTQGYADVTDITTIAKFELTDESDTYVLAWTTTPWTLPGNLLLAIHTEEIYWKLKANEHIEEASKQWKGTVLKKGEMIWTSQKHAKQLLDRDAESPWYEVVEKAKGKTLVGKKYRPPFPYFEKEYADFAFYITEGNDFVTTEDGTGVVHIAPAFGEDDFNVGQRENIEPLLHHVNIDGTFIDQVRDFSGLSIKPSEDTSKTDKKLIEWLGSHHKLFTADTYKHSYPHCWRCDNPLLNYTTSSWFVSIDAIKERMLNANSRTEWVPKHVRDGRFGNWLQNARDWAISRNRYWGTPLPIWKHGDTVDVIGSRSELMERKKIRFSKITVLRHAESEGNVIPIYQGKNPGTNLTIKGKGQAKQTGKWLSSQNVDVIYCSPLARTIQTAEILAKETGAKVVVDERLREVDFGKWEGKTVDFSDPEFLKTRRREKLEAKKAESIFHFDGMETWESVQNRVNAFLEETLPKHRSEHIVIVSHADPVINIEYFFTKEDPIKLSHRPYPEKAVPTSYYWDHSKNQQVDLHKDTVDDVLLAGYESDQSIELTLVRHGQTDWNAKSLSQGQTDNTLNDIGRKQALETAMQLKDAGIDAIVSSDLSRAKETAEIIGAELGIAVDATWKELRERDEGAWDGKHIDEVLSEYPAANEQTKSVSFHHATPPEGESLTAFLERAELACKKLLKEYSGKKVIVVSHGGTVRALHATIQNLSYKEALEKRAQNAEAAVLTLNPFMERIPEVLDCWFESGSMPYAQQHYPFEMKHDGEETPLNFPADFIAEGMDQTRGWFYTLTVLGAALFDTSPFEHCVVNGIVLAEDGKKMSKRLKNYPEPLDVVHRHGADAVRFTLMSSPAVRGEDLRFSEALVEEHVRSVLLPLWNTYSFFVTYANAAKFEPVDTRTHSTHPLDVWIRAEVQDLVNRMTKELDHYDLSATCNELHETIDSLTNWYVRLSRKRFAGGDEQEKADALHTLYDVLLTLSQVLAPFCPFITDAMYLNLAPNPHGSIHLTDWPDVKKLSSEQEALLTKNRIMRSIVSLGNSIRAEKKVKVRQPLAKAVLALPPSMNIAFTKEDHSLLLQELNVKEVEFADNPEELAEAFVQVDARKVGPRLGKRVQDIIQAGKNGDFTVQDDGTILILDESLSPDEAVLSYRGKEGKDAAADRGVVVSMDAEITDALKLEGEARDLIRGIQRVRKECGLEFNDMITLEIVDADDIVKEHEDLITTQTHSVLGTCKGEDYTMEVGDRKVTIRFLKQ